MSRKKSIFVALGLAAVLAAGAAAAQNPPPGLPAGHPPVAMPQQPAGQGQPGQPGQQPIVRPLPGRPANIPPGRPIGPGGRQFPPGRPIPGPGGRAHAEPAEPEHKSHGAEVCPGHGPMDPPHHVNWWRGLIGVNNERAAGEGFSLDHLLWRYHNDKDPCDPKNEPPPFLASVLNFGLLAFILYHFGKKPLAEALVKRKQAIMGEIDNATRLKDEAEGRLEEYEEKLDHLEETLEQLKAEYASQAAVERKNLLAELEERRARMRRDAEFRIEQELKAARLELLHEAVNNAVAAAEEILRKHASAEDQGRLADDYLAAIPAALGEGAGRREASTTGAMTS
ncbi:MAG: ATP synthase F0 subunit B [Polyangiaceae bacterium]|nr:ATP synthase F0 subunit B [Polyangiaceae bacterium]